MNKKGFFALLTAAMAGAWETVVTQLKATFRYRVAGDTDNDDLPESNGRAVINAIYGNTIKWNQLVDTNTTEVTLESGKVYYIKTHGYAQIEYPIGHSTVVVEGGSDTVIDLTAIFGAGDEPSTTAAFEAWLALNVGEQDYYPHDEGSLISFKGQGVKSVGFNRWDEQWGLYTYGPNGNRVASTTNVGCTNKIECLPNTTYYVKRPDTTVIVKCEYDINGRFISGTRANLLTNTEFTTSQNTYYFTFYCGQAYGTTYHNDICINISNAAKNGTYKPYWSDEKPFDVTKVYGKLNGAGNYVQCFPNGMRSAGSVHDTLTANEAVVKIGGVALESLSYTYINLHDATPYFRAGLPADFKYERNQINYIVNQYTEYAPMTYMAFESNNVDRIFAVRKITSGDTTQFYIRNLQYTDPTLFKESLSASGINAYYEITPITYTDLIYSEDGGVTGIPLTKLKYKVDKYSTEELLVPASEAGEPTSTAIIADIDYQKKG